MTDKLTTTQKAEAYVSGYRNSRLTVAKEGIEIITALLKENRALLEALILLYADGGLHREAFRKKVQQAIAMCEENQDDN